MAIPPYQGPSQQEITLAQELVQKLETFQELTPPSRNQLADFAKAITALYEASRETLPVVQNLSTLLREEVHDAADIAQTVLNEVLDIKGTSPNTLMGAAKAFQEKPDLMNSDLAKIAETFSQYSESTNSLKIELAQISGELKNVIEDLQKGPR